MSDLRKRTCIHYLKDAMKMLLLALGIEAIIIVEQIILSVGELDSISSMFSSAIVLFGLFILLLNVIYAMYGPAWTDSIVLSMGVRRSDIYVGNILKEITFAGAGLIILLAACNFTGTYDLMFYSIYVCIASLVCANVARIIGYKIRKFGKIAIMVTVVICSLSGMAVGMSVALDGLVFDWLKFSVNTTIITWGVALVIYVILQGIVRRLNSKTRVQ